MRGMKPEDVYALKGVSDPRLSPDGTTVAFVLWSIDGEANEYRGNIWLAPVDGSEPPRRFTTGERRDGEPRWSPDGSSLAFVSSRAEKEPGQLYVISLRGGTITTGGSTRTGFRIDGSDSVSSFTVYCGGCGRSSTMGGCELGGGGSGEGRDLSRACRHDAAA